MVQQLLTDIADRGLSLHADGADLRLLGPRAHMDTDLVARIRANKPALLEALRVPDGTPPTGLQRSYLLGRQDLAGTGATASYVYHEFLGTWDVKRLERALNEVIARHDSLRTRFTDAGMRVVEPFVRLRVDVRDLRQLDSAARTETLARLREERSHRVLPVDRAPLVSCEVSLLGGEQMICSVGHDGLALDGISMFLFFRELQQAYDGALATTPSPVSFDAYVDVLRRRGADTATRRAAEHWRARLDDLPESPQLPMRAEPGSTRFHRREIRIGAPRWQALQRRIQAAATTPTAVLLGAYAEVLSFWGAGPRMTITTTMADRPPIHPGIYGAVGQFSDVLLVELDADPRQPFQDRVEAVTARLRRDLDNRRYSGLSVLRDLHERTGARSGHGNRMPYTFNSTLGYPDAAATGSALSAFGHETFGVSQTPGVWLNVFVMEQDGALVIQFDAVDGLFVDGVLDGLAESYRTLLGGLLEERAWAAPTHDLLPAAQRARRRAVNDTAAPMCEEQAHEAFFRRAAEAPDAVAVIAPGRTLSYGELAARAREVASWVRHQGAGRDDLVALVMRRGPEQIVAILGVALAGAAYLPIDAGMPEQRREYLLRDSAARCVLTNLDHGVPGARRVDLDAPVADEVVESRADADPDDLLYVLYTSGTTGEPKGVMVSHRSVGNVAGDCNERFAIGPSDRFFAISAFNFDLSVYDVFGALGAGAALVLPAAGSAADPAHWLALCGEHGVTVWNSVPAIVGLLAEQLAENETGQSRLRLLMMSGDKIPPALPARLRALLPAAELVSLGGPTETTIWNILHPIEDVDAVTDAVPYGRPNANNRCHVLDEHGRHRPDWVVGEICAAGVGLARGYRGDPARTAQRFGELDGERIYRTGDLGRYRPDGTIMILGRTDFQIKINGYRIEAGEVETRLGEIPGVASAAVVRQDGRSGSRLVAHLAGAAGVARPSDAEVRSALRAVLPEYMVPAVLHWHERLPLTGNGKLDRAALERTAEPPPTEVAPTPRVSDASAPDPVLEARIGAIWAAVLDSAVPPPTSGFTDLGGSSLAAARVLTRVRKEFGVAIALDEFPVVDTVRTMAAAVTARAGTGGGQR